MKKYILIIILTACSIPGFSANREIKGLVTSSEDNLPLIGASVFVSSDDLKKIASPTDALGVMTAIDGSFALNIPEGITRIYCSYLGHNQKEIKLGKESFYNIVLDPSSYQLDNIVVTGYQNIERRKLTSAVSKVKITDELIGNTHSIDQVLAGQVAGLSAVTSTGAPGAPVKIRIRGTSSINGTQDPLWVLDGLPLEGTDIPKIEDLQDIDNIYNTTIAGINPNDIEDITVLKDAAATAIYGARAANGVIVITTKSGKKGKTKVSFSAKLSYTPNVNIDRLNLLNSDEKVQLEMDLLQSDYTYRENKGGVSQLLQQYGQLDAFKTGGFSAISPEAQAAINQLRNTTTDWNDILFRDAFNQEYNLNLSGGSDRATYYTSLGYYTEKGNVIGVDANRFNFTGKTSYTVNKYLKLGAGIFANQMKNRSFLTDADSFSSPTYYSRRANSYQTVYDESNNYVYDNNVQGKGDDRNADFNIFEERANTSHQNTAQSFKSIFDVELKINSMFKIVSQVGLQIDRSTIEKIADADSYSIRKDRLRSLVGGQSFLPEGGFHKQTETNSSQVTWKAMGEFRKNIRDEHEIEAMLGTEIRKTWYRSLYSAAYGYDRKTMQSKPILFPEERHADLFPLNTLTEQINAYASGFATFSYSFKHRYTLGASIRFDGSDLFGVDKKYRYLPLYSVSGLWRISSESFMQDIDWLNNLAIRASYGLQGNIDKNTSPKILGQYVNTSILPGQTETAIYISSPPNDKLRWEKTHSANAGIDLAVLNGRINFTGDYYYRKGVDLIGTQMLPLESGFSSTSINWASMQNRGVELSLNTHNIKTKNFDWHTTFNIAYNQNRVLEISTPESQWTPSLKGYAIGSVFAYPFGGLDSEGYPLFITPSGEKVSAAQYFNISKIENGNYAENLTIEERRNLYKYAGTTDPVWSGGFFNTFRIQRFEIGVNCIFNLGHIVRINPSYSPALFDRGMNVNRDILNRWTPTNTNTVYPTLMSDNKREADYYAFEDLYADRSLDLYVKRADYMRVQSVRVGYQLPEKVLNLFKMSSGSVSLEGRNLLVWAADYTNYLDPETMGNEYAQPIPKSITLTLNLNF
ncbi:MAG: SusC/RagA family TonB-linked outer membrane protein [Coprobacter sp.]|nr:SusC/RagA family TonB-linked outer membrane protein [Coprobacter sp.]